MSMTRGGLLWVLLVLATAVPGAHGQEPVRYDGRWAGTWWMGKYEEPIEMELSQSDGLIEGRVAMHGYPGADQPAGSGGGILIQSGRLDGHRLLLAWPMGGTLFTATLTPTAAGTLMGLGGEAGRVVTGFELRRVR